MSKALIALACSLLLLCAGCGSNNGAARKTACFKATTAMTQYHRVGSEQGLDFFNTAANYRTIAAAAQFRLRVAELQRLSNAAERRALQRLVDALTQHEAVLRALAKHHAAEAQRLLPGLEAATEQSQASFNQICKRA